ncbi:MAG: hypothetical protein JXI43_02350, partial [Tissierellales bacterium]|nr:hypothetical protein [Tissierellales bacterium]
EEYEPAYGFIATILYREKNDIESAEIWFKKAEKANCLFAPVAYEYGMLKYYERRDYEIALRYLLKSAEDDYELSYGVIGIIYYAEKHELNNALNWFRKAEKVNCLFAPAAYEYGMLFLEKGDIDQALKYLLIAAEDNYDLAYEELVKIYHESGDHENEKMWYKRIEEETIS